VYAGKIIVARAAAFRGKNASKCVRQLANGGGNYAGRELSGEFSAETFQGFVHWPGLESGHLLLLFQSSSLKIRNPTGGISTAHWIKFMHQVLGGGGLRRVTADLS